MAVTISPGKRSCNILWNVGKMKSSASNVFFLENSKWCFLLEVESNTRHNEEDWKMYLKKISPKEGNHAFLISVYAEDRLKRLECLNFTKLDVHRSGIQQIMWRRKSNILLKYPDLKLDGDISFVITILSDYMRITDMKNCTDSKCTQTPSYMEIQPCLESLSNDFCRLWKNRSEADLEIRCGDKTLRVHKAVLIARSQVFEAMLLSNMLEKSENFVEIVDLDCSILEIFLKYLYTGTLPDTDVDICTELYKAADKYCVDSLKTRCALFLKENLTDENACNMLILADTYCDNDLKHCVTSYMIQKDIFMYMEDGQAFCALHPKLAVDVLYQAYQIMKLTLKDRNKLE